MASAILSSKEMALTEIEQINEAGISEKKGRGEAQWQATIAVLKFQEKTTLGSDLIHMHRGKSGWAELYSGFSTASGPILLLLFSAQQQRTTAVPPHSYWYDIVTCGTERGRQYSSVKKYVPAINDAAHM